MPWPCYLLSDHPQKTFRAPVLLVNMVDRYITLVLFAVGEPSRCAVRFFSNIYPPDSNLILCTTLDGVESSLL